MKIARIDEYPELKDTLAELTAEGASQTAIAEAMGVKDRGTIAAWQKRPEIQARVTRLIRERSNRILSQTTKRIEGILNSGKNLSLENLLKIQREFGGQLIKIDDGGDPAKALEEIFLAAHDDEALAEGLAKLNIEAAADVEPADA